MIDLTEPDVNCDVEEKNKSLKENISNLNVLLEAKLTPHTISHINNESLKFDAVVKGMFSAANDCMEDEFLSFVQQMHEVQSTINALIMKANGLMDNLKKLKTKNSLMEAAWKI